MANKLTAIAEVLADLPADQRADVIAKLDSAERETLALMLVGLARPEGQK